MSKFNALPSRLSLTNRDPVNASCDVFEELSIEVQAKKLGKQVYVCDCHINNGTAVKFKLAQVDWEGKCIICHHYCYKMEESKFTQQKMRDKYNFVLGKKSRDKLYG